MQTLRKDFEVHYQYRGVAASVVVRMCRPAQSGMRVMPRRAGQHSLGICQFRRQAISLRASAAAETHSNEAEVIRLARCNP